MDTTTLRTEPATQAPPEPGLARGGVVLTVLGFMMLGAAGLILWASQSESLFASYLSGALAACF